MVLFPENDGSGGPDPFATDPLESLVRRILEAAGPELERLRHRVTLAGQIDLWTGALLPLAAALILVFGSTLAWVGTDAALDAAESPLIAEALVPEQLGLWLEAGASFTLAEFVEVLEEGGK